MTAADEGLAFDYESLWYIKIRGEGDKRPKETWGGYSQDFEAADCVYSYDEVRESDETNWAIVGIREREHTTRSLLTFDIDIHKAPDDFDPDDITIPESWPVRRSQSGGLHTDVIALHPRGAAKEGDFEMTKDLGFDIDIRGSFVSHHTVAPADIPGVGGPYEIARDRPIPGWEPDKAAAAIRYKGEPLLEYKPDRFEGDGATVSVDRAEDAPDDMPTCYARALAARAAEGRPDGYQNDHGVNRHAAILGAYAGYSADEQVEHFKDYPPNGDPGEFDATTTRRAVEGTIEKIDADDLAPVSVAKLRESGLFDDDETCDADCPIHGSDDVVEKPDAEPVAVLPPAPNSPRARAQATAWGGLDADVEPGEPGPAAADTDAGLALSQEDVYNRVTETIADAMERHDQVVIDAIMGGGKTYNGFGAAKRRDERPAYFAPREELYEQGAEYARENGFDDDEIFILPTALRDCPTFQGKRGEEWEHRVKTLYRRGATPKAIHNLLGDELPCCQNEDGKCPYELKCEIDPDDYEVVIGHYKHAHLPHVTKGRHAIFDENPTDTFTTRITGGELIQGVNAFLALQDSPPFDTFTDLLEHRHSDDERRERALAWFETFDFEPDEQNVVRFESEGYHAYAPHAVYTILTADPVDEGGYAFEKASLPGLDNEGLFFATDEQYGEYFVELQTPPELTYARSVIALDGTPFLHPDDDRPREWENALGRPLNHRQVLTDDEREGFLAHTQGHTYVQTSPDIRPYSSGKWNNKRRDAALLAAVTDRYGGGDPPVVFTSYKVRQEYEDEFTDAGLAADFDHPNNIRGSNEYAACRFAVQLGSSHHGDHELMRRAAWLGEAVEPEGKGVDRDYGAVGNEVLWQFREAQAAQNALRVGRDGGGAVVVLDTAAYPDWLPVEDGVGDVSLWSPTERQVREAVAAIREDEGKHATTAGVTTADLADHPAVDGGESAVRKACRRHAGRGLLEKRTDDDDARRARWVDDGLGDLDPAGAAEVDLPDFDVDDADDAGAAEVAARSHMDIYTRPSRNFDTDTPSTPAAADANADAATIEGDPPPD